MPLELAKDVERKLVASIRRFARDELEMDFGDLKASLVLEFFLQELAPAVYNQGVADAQRHLQRAVEDVSGVVYAPPGSYGSTRP